MQDRIQLNREEIVGDGTALSNINPLTNTKSVDDNLTGESLDVTINRIWNAINNKLSRVVNSVNGRDGVVVITAKDVGLENVTNVSFSTIKDWVLDQLLQEFNLKSIKLFDTYNEFLTTFETDWLRDKARSGIPFYIRVGGPDNDTRSQIGYTIWDAGDAVNKVVMKPINVIYEADNTLIYNENLNGKDYTGGHLGVNIWTGEDALKVYNAASKAQSGLYIDKSKIAPVLKFFNSIYGNGEPGDLNALIYVLPSGGSYPEGTNHVTIKMNGVIVQDAVYGTNFPTYQSFKIYDLVLSNFSDENCRSVDGSLKSGFNEYFIKREACIGSITDVQRVGTSYNYTLEFYTIKPYVGKGLAYIDTHTQDGRHAGMIGLDLVEGKTRSDLQVDNLSGVNAFSGNLAAPAVGVDQALVTVTPYGATPATSFKNSNKMFIAPDFSLNVIPYNTFNTGFTPMENWPMKTPHVPTGLDKPDFFGVNLLKRISTSGAKAVNMSGLRIFANADEISNADLGKSDSDTTDKLNSIINHFSYELISSAEAPEWWGNETPIVYSDDQGTVVHFTNTGTEEVPVWSPAYQQNTFYLLTNIDSSNMSTGGLAVNVGKFLEIGTYVGSDVDSDTHAPINEQDGYYDGGKVNLRVADDFFKDDGTNKLNLRLSQYRAYPGKDTNAVLGGGLTYSPGLNPEDVGPVSITPGLTINRGLGLRMSHYDKSGQEPLDAADKAFLAVSVIDSQYTINDIGTVADDRIRGYGGLRYLIGDEGSGNQSAIGLRVNGSDSTYGHELRLGDRAIGIDERNVVQVQRYRESDNPVVDTNPLVIKGWDEEAIYPYVHIKGLSGTIDVATLENLPGKVGNPYESPRADKVYFVKAENRRYVWTGNGSGAGENDYVTMFTSYNELQNGDWNRVYVETLVDNTNHTFIGRAYQWYPEYTVQLPGSWVPDETEPGGGHYRDDGPLVNSITSSAALEYYALMSTLHDSNKGYYWVDPNTNIGYMYWDGAHQTPMSTLEDGGYYADITNGVPYVFYKYTASTDTFTNVNIINGHTWIQQDIMPLDVNCNGTIDAIDASTLLSYYAYASQTTPTPVIPEYDAATTIRGKFEAWLKYYGIAQDRSLADGTAGYKVIHATDPNGSFMPGLDINLNKWQGITSELNGDIHNSVSVKIYDRTAGVPNCATDDGDDPSKMDYMQGMYQGGLRFNKEGYLGVRVNAMNTYNATTPSGRAGGDYCRCETYKHGELMHDLGARGLRIYGNNVLGIQLDVHGTLDNGQLAFDEDGSLIISPQYHGGGGGGEFLTLTDGTTTVQYNGSSAINITLGPGLILEPDPAPTPNEEPGE